MPSPLYPQSHSSAGVFQKNSAVNAQPQYLNPTQSQNQQLGIFQQNSS